MHRASDGESMARYLFPRWSNQVFPRVIAFGLVPLAAATGGGLYYYGGNKHLEVGYSPEQPVAYSHKLHAGDLGLELPVHVEHAGEDRAAAGAQAVLLDGGNRGPLDDGRCGHAQVVVG